MKVYRIDTNDRLRHLILNDYDFNLKIPKCYKKSYLSNFKNNIFYANNTFGDKSKNSIHFYKFALDALHLKKQNVNQDKELNFCVYDIPDDKLEAGYGNYFSFGIKREYIAKKSDVTANMVKQILLSEQKINRLIFDELDNFINYYATVGKAIEMALDYKDAKIDDRIQLNSLPRERGLLKHCEQYLNNIASSIYKLGHFSDEKFSKFLDNFNKLIEYYYKQLDFLTFDPAANAFYLSQSDNPVKRLSEKISDLSAQGAGEAFKKLEDYYKIDDVCEFSFKNYFSNLQEDNLIEK